MKTIIFTCIFCFVASILLGQNNTAKIRKNNHGVVEYVKFPPTPQSSELKQVAVPETAPVFFKEYLKTTPPTSFIKQPRKQRDKDFVHEHYDQYYDGVKVDGGRYNFHFKKGRMYLAHGNYVKIEGLSTKPSITVDMAKEVFARYKEIPVEEVSNFKADLLIKEIPNISGTDTVYAVALVFRVYLVTGHPNNDEIGYIDAHTGKVFITEPSMTSFTETATFATRYNGSRQATTQYYNSTYNLCDSSRNAIIHTQDLNGSTNINNAVELTDNNNNWTAAEHSSNEDDMGLDIHWALQEIYDYFDDEYSISSFDNDDFDIDAYFHYGEQDNARWLMADDALVFGNGNTIFSPVASLDAVAHEYGHGITDFQIGWAYSGDLRIFHEGLSDIWAVILENRISPNSIWEICEEITLNDDCLRNIQDPDDPNADTEISDTYLSTTYNSGDHYTKSGVFSHWFYLLVNGGTGTNDNNDDYTVYGIGMDATEELVVESVFNGYLNTESTYPGIRTQIVDAAEEEVFDPNSFQALQVEAAWYAVGVGTNPVQVTVTGDYVICSNGKIITANNSPTGSTINWTTSSNLKVDSGQGTTTPTIKPKYASSQGAGWVQVNYTTGSYITAGPRQDVWVDKFANTVVTGQAAVCPNSLYVYTAQVPVGDPSDYTYVWTYPSGWYKNSQWDNKIQLQTPQYNMTYGTVRVSIDNGCGFSSYSGITVYPGYCGGYYMSFSPNPTTGETTLTIESTSEEKTVDENAEWELEIYSPNQALKEKKTKLKGNSTTIQTQGWKEGVYVVRVKYNPDGKPGEVLSGKLVVKK